MAEIIDNSVEIDIDLGIGQTPIDPSTIKEAAKPKARIPSNPMMEEFEEEIKAEDDFEPDEEPKKSAFQLRKEEEREFYDTLTDEEEQEAWREGWRKGKFFKGVNRDGTPRPEISAKEFLARRKEIGPINNERTRTLARENTELHKQIQELLRYNKAKEEREIKLTQSTLDQQEDQAILEGDLDKVKAIRAQRANVEKEKFTFSEAPKQQEANDFTPRDKDTFNEWAAENSWFYNDLKLQGYASNMFNELHHNQRHIPLADRLQMIQDEVEDRFGDKIFKHTRKPVRVDSGVRGMQSNRPKTLSYNEIPAEAKAMCEGFIKKGKMSLEAAKKLRADYVKEYSTN